MTIQDINKIINNLTKDGLTRGEAFVKTRNLMLRRLEHVRRGSEIESCFLDDLVLLDNLWVGR